MPARRYSLGFDFGTESVRVLVVDIADGHVAGQAAADYAHGVIDHDLPATGKALPADYALQHPQDWLDSLARATRSAMKQAKASGDAIVGIGVDFTSCTMLPTLADGTPLCLTKKLAPVPLAWPKLWKHHGAKSQCDRINAIVRERREPWLARYGGAIGLEWFFPKLLETLEHAPAVYRSADLFLEAGDWLVWQLTSGPFPRCRREDLVRSTCQAGYKAMWNAQDGYPSPAFLSAVNPGLADAAAQKMPGKLLAPGQRAGMLTEPAGRLLGLPAGIPVSAAIIDAHAGVPGAGVASAGTLVMVMGTSSCHMLNATAEKLVPGIAGVVEGGILPGFYGYETGQASVGDAFAWVARTLNLSHEELALRAQQLPPGSGGVLAIDWLNGCRTPLMDGRLSGAFVGLTLGTRPEQLYRAMMEATAFGVRWIIESLEQADVPVDRLVASGGLPAKSPLLMQVYADVLGRPIHLAESGESVALGAAILGCIAAGPKATGYATMDKAIGRMARWRKDLVYKPAAKARKAYTPPYRAYRDLAAGEGVVAETMRKLREAAGGGR